MYPFDWCLSICIYICVCILITLVQFRKPWYYKSILYALFQPISCATSVYELISRIASMFEHKVGEECDFTRNLSTVHQSHCLRYQQIQNYHRSLVSSFGVILVENSMSFPTMNDDGLPTRTLPTISLNRHRQDYIFFAKSRDILQYVDNYLVLVSQNTSLQQLETPTSVTCGYCGYSYPAQPATCSAFSWKLFLSFDEIYTLRRYDLLG